VEFLSKPYDRERLAMKVRRIVLDGRFKKTGDSEPTGTKGEASTNILFSWEDK
jgi:hypothetical protein